MAAEDGEESEGDAAAAPGPKAEATWTRTVVLDRSSVPKESTNAVSTTKYTWVNFLPKSFLLQFRRIGNVWFVVVVVLMLIGSYGNPPLYSSPQKPWGNLFIVVVVFGINMLQQALDDRKRAKKDLETNEQPAYVLNKGVFQESTWGAVQRGDIIRLEKDRTCPADVLLISTSDMQSEPLCYVETSNIDGETYLKKRYCSPEVTAHCRDLRHATEWLEGREVAYEKPNASLTAFQVAIKPKAGEPPGDIRLDFSNVILRGAELRNTTWAIGVVLYVGRDTKALVGQDKRPVKRSRVDRLVDKVIASIFVLLAIMLFLTATLPLVAFQPSEELWYMGFTDESSGVIFPDWLAMVMANLILLRQIIPILVFPLLEFSSAAQANYIGWDLKMRDPDTGRFASCNTTSLAQEIGQVKWIFSDKTGTLTCNEMRLVAFSVGGVRYGRVSGPALRHLASLGLPPLASVRTCFSDALGVLVEAGSQNPQRQALCRFLKALSLCHTVLVESTPDNAARRDSTRKLRRSKLSSCSPEDGEAFEELTPSPLSPLSATTVLDPAQRGQSRERDLPRYNAESPDEEALVTAANALGFQFRYSDGDATIGIHLKRARPTDSMSSPDLSLGPIREAFAETVALGAPAQTKECNAADVELRVTVPTPETRQDDGGRDMDALSSDTKSSGGAAPAAPAAPAIEKECETATMPKAPLFRLASDRHMETEEWTVLAVNPFSSFRKRMSVLYEDPNTPGRTVLLCKGADNQMLSASQVGPEQESELKSTLLFYAQNGLRTLVVAEREVEEAEREAWLAKHAAACALKGDERKIALEEVAVEIERDLEVLGVTAVEDRLQEGVPKTISLLREAKINFWLITGDKVETALNISTSAGLITSSSEVFQLTLPALGIEVSGAQSAITDADVQQRLLQAIQEVIERQRGKQRTLTFEDGGAGNWKGCCLRLIQIYKSKVQSPPAVADGKLAMVVDGQTLGFVLAALQTKRVSKPLKKKRNLTPLAEAFLLLSRMCGVVIACRASPTQKAQLVGLVKDNIAPKPITLAIGDGANDCPMIERAHVGVGLAGKEGTQAASAADFTLGKFRFLAPLLMVHGRLGYLRVSKGITLVFYGNLLFTFVSFYYNFVCAFSGTPAFDNAQYLIFQAFIAIPVFLIVWVDRDYKDVYDVLDNPRKYDLGRLNRILHPAMVDGQILLGMTHGAFAFLLVFWGDPEATYVALSSALWLVVTFVLTERQARFISLWTWPVVAGLVANAALVITIVGVSTFNRYGASIFSRQEAGRYFWNQVVVTGLLAGLIDYIGPGMLGRVHDYSKTAWGILFGKKQEQGAPTAAD